MSVAALVALVLLSSPALASIDGDADMSKRGDVSTHVSYEAPRDASQGGATPSENRKRAPVLRREVIDRPASTSLEGWCLPKPVPKPPAPQYGYEYWILYFGPDGRVTNEIHACVPYGGADTSVPPRSPEFPDLPTYEEAWKSARIPSPAITTDPASRGITGLETRISTAGPTELRISATVRGYTVTGIATLDHYTIAIDGGAPKRADRDAFVFETKGKHTITIAAVWRGRATLVGNELVEPMELGDIGTATVTATREYQVNEVRSVLQPSHD